MPKVLNNKVPILAVAVSLASVAVLSLLLLGARFDWYSSTFRLVSGTLETMRPVSEQYLLEFAQSPVDLSLHNSPPSHLGDLRGTSVIVEYFCEDVCPASTTRIIRYDVPVGETCEEVGGEERPLFMGGWSGERTFCFPKVLADNWGLYRAGAHY